MDGVLYWFLTVLFGSDMPEDFFLFGGSIAICFSGIAVLLTLAFVFKFILKLVER